MRALRLGTSWGGLLSGPLAWAISTQLNYSLVHWQCNRQVQVVLPVALLLAVLAHVAYSVPLDVRLPGLVGAPASLNFYVALVGASGRGSAGLAAWGTSRVTGCCFEPNGPN